MGRARNTIYYSRGCAYCYIMFSVVKLYVLSILGVTCRPSPRLLSNVYAMFLLKK